MRTLKFKRILLSMRLLVLAVITELAIASCQSQTSNPKTYTLNKTDCRTIEHEAGATEVCDRPQRIVALGPYVLEPLLALGVQPVAFGDHVAFHQGDYDNPQEQIPYLGSMITQPLANVGLAYEPSIEAIAKAQPDLIIGIEANTKQYDTLSQIAPTILLEYADAENSLKAIAQAVDRIQQAEQLLEETEQQIAAARKKFAPLIAKNPKLLLLDSAQLKQINLTNSTELCSSLPKELGFQLVSPPELNNAESDSSIPISIESLLQLNDADSVIMLGYNLSELENMNNFKEHQLLKLKQAWQNNAIAQSLDASKAQRVYFIPVYLCKGLPGAIGTKLYLKELEQQLLPPQ